MHNKVTNYTALSGDIDDIRYDIPCIQLDIFKDNRMNAKLPKILSHKFISGDTIWTDANIRLLVPAEQLIDEWLGDDDIIVFSHPWRKNSYEEIERCIKKYPEYKEILIEQKNKYISENFNGGKLAECGMIIRKNNFKVAEFNEAWWAEICRWSSRDQISFPYVISKFPSLKVNYIKGNVRKHEYFQYTEHKR